MRWEAMFADLEAQAGALDVAERAAEIGDRVRAELGSLSLLDRLRPAVDTPLRLRTVGAGVLSGVLRRCGPDWALLAADGGQETLVRLGAVTGISGLGRESAAPGTMDAVSRRLGLWFVLRRIARDRAPVTIALTDGAGLHATIDRVGADFVEVAVHERGQARRNAAVRERLLVPMSGLAAVRREP